MSRSDYIFCLMHFYLFCLVSYHLLCHHGGMARDWPRTDSYKTSPKPWLPGYVRRRTITIISTSDPITPSMAPLSSTAKNFQSSIPEENTWSMPVSIVMALAIVAFLVGLYLAIITMWNKQQETTNTLKEKPWSSSHDTID